MSNVSESSQTISARGTIQNMLNQGFSDKACISENIDDSLGANAKHIRIRFDKYSHKMIHSDDGIGMSRDQCFEAHRLNNRKDKSKERHGRFGIGRKQAQAVLTNLEDTSKTLTKFKDNIQNEEGVVELDINWKECIEKDKYEITPHDITAKSVSLWKDNAIDPKKTGTVTIVPCSKTHFKNLIYQAESKNIPNSLVFNIGRTYWKAINSGVSITVTIDDKDIPVKAIDPSIPSYTEQDKRKQYHMFVSTNKDGEVRVHSKDENNKYIYRDFTNSTVGKVQEEKKMSDWKPVGQLKKTCIYIPDDKIIQAFNIEPNRYVIPNEKGIQELRSFLGGRYYVRNGKVISRFDIPKKTSGDTAHYKYYEEVIEIIEFDSDLDDYFAIEVNKSNIETMNINETIKLTINALKNDFAKEMISKFCDCKKCKPYPPEASNVSQTTNNTTPTSNPIVNPAPKPTTVAPPVAPTPASKPTPVAPTVNTVATPNTNTAPKPAANTTTAPAPSSHVVVGEHTREQSKSAKEVLELAMNFAERLMNAPNLDDIYRRANTQAQKGYVKYWNTLRELEDVLLQLGIDMEEA